MEFCNPFIKSVMCPHFKDKEIMLITQNNIACIVEKLEFEP